VLGSDPRRLCLVEAGLVDGERDGFPYACGVSPAEDCAGIAGAGNPKEFAGTVVDGEEGARAGIAGSELGDCVCEKAGAYGGSGTSFKNIGI